MGKSLTLVKADDEGKPASGVVALKRMISTDNVSAVVGVWHSSVALAQSKVADKEKVPIMLHYSWTDKLTAAHSNYIFRVGPYNTEIANLLMPFIAKNYKTMGLMYETTAFGAGFADAVKVAAAAAGIDVYDVGFSMDSTDLKPQLMQLKAKNPKPEVLLVVANYQGMYLIPKQAHEIELAPECEILTSWDYPAWSPEWWEVTGKTGVGAMYATFESEKIQLSKLGEEFKSSFIEKYDFAPPVYAYFLYDEVMMLAETMEKIQSSDPRKIAAALKDISFNGTTGKITFSRDDAPGPVWNQWLGHQIFVKKLTEFEQKGADSLTIYP